MGVAAKVVPLQVPQARFVATELAQIGNQTLIIVVFAVSLAGQAVASTVNALIP